MALPPWQNIISNLTSIIFFYDLAWTGSMKLGNLIWDTVVVSGKLGNL
jgi:hypothetical protein